MNSRPGQPALFTDTPGTAELAHLFDPARLTQARVLAGMTKRELAEYVGVSPAAIGQYEARITTPRPALLERLARAVDQQVGFFTGDRPFVQVDTGDAHFRSLRSMRSADRARALATAEQIWELTCALERHVQLPEVVLPETMPGASPVTAATALRRHWQQDRGPIRHLVATMESHGIIVLLAAGTDYIDRVDAFSTVISGRPLVMSTPRRSRDVYRHRFTCAHELGHFMLHRDHTSGDVTLERQADEFAAEYLTPAAEMRSVLPQRMDLTALTKLGRDWGVSTQSLVRRMSELRLVSDATVRRAYIRLNALRSLTVEEPVHAYPGELPRVLRDAVGLADTVGHGMAELARELRWSPRRIDQLLGVEDARPVLRLAP